MLALVAAVDEQQTGRKSWTKFWDENVEWQIRSLDHVRDMYRRGRKHLGRVQAARDLRPGDQFSTDHGIATVVNTNMADGVSVEAVWEGCGPTAYRVWADEAWEKRIPAGGRPQRVTSGRPRSTTRPRGARRSA